MRLAACLSCSKLVKESKSCCLLCCICVRIHIDRSMERSTCPVSIRIHICTQTYGSTTVLLHLLSHTAYSIPHTAYSIPHTAYSIPHTAYSIFGILALAEIALHNINKQMKSSFPNSLSAIPENELGMWSSKIAFWYRDLYIRIHPDICTYLWRALFQSMISELGIDLATSIVGLALNAFWKWALQI